MIRLMLLSCAFVGVTGGLIVALLPPAEESTPTNTVSRAQAAPLSLQPAIPAQTLPQPAAIVVPTPQPAPSPAADVTPEPALARVAPPAPVAPVAEQVRPQQRPADLVPVSAPAVVAEPEPKPVLAQPISIPVAKSNEEVDDTVNAIGHSIVQQLMQPTLKAPADTPAPARQQAIVVPAPTPTPAPTPAPVPVSAPETVEYLIKDGDSLPGLAFRFFGTTAAYLSIVDANPILRDDPAAFRAGLTINIPKTP